MKDKYDSRTEDWVALDDDRREREMQEILRRQARKDKQRERTSIEKTSQDSGRSKANSAD